MHLMQGAKLKRLSDAGSVSKGEMASGNTTLWSDESGNVIGWYRGAYAVCGVTVEATDQLRCSVSSKEFSQLAELFDDDAEVKLVLERANLNMSAGRTRFKLRTEGNPSIESYTTLLNEYQPMAKVDRTVFVQEIQAASAIVATSMENPILTGVHIVAKNGRMGLQAGDGRSKVLTAEIPKPEVMQDIDIVVPGADLQNVLKYLGDNTVVNQAHRKHLIVGMMKNTLVLHTHDAIFRIPTLSGAWPSMMASLSKMEFGEGTIEIPSNVIEKVARANRIFNGDAGSKTVTVKPAPMGDMLIIETMEGEKGHFAQEFDGTVDRPFTLDIEDLSIVAKIFGDSVTIEFGKTMSRVTGDKSNRRVYVLQRA